MTIEAVGEHGVAFRQEAGRQRLLCTTHVHADAMRDHRHLPGARRSILRGDELEAGDSARAAKQTPSRTKIAPDLLQPPERICWKNISAHLKRLAAVGHGRNRML